MIDLLIVSKDRACQLRLLLESLAVNAPGLFRIQVNYVASQPQFRDGYRKLILENIHSDITWCYEFNRRVEFLEAMHNAQSDLFCIGTDDSVCYRPLNASEDEIRAVFDKDTLCFSFRLGLNTIIQDYRTQELQTPLAKYECLGSKFIRWNYTKYDAVKNYGYPIAMDFHMYNTEQIRQLTEELNFDSFRIWEGVLALAHRWKYVHKPKMASFRQSVVVNVPTNNVQPGLYAGNLYPLSVEELNQGYLEGRVLSLSDFPQDIRGCHQEIQLKIINEPSHSI